MAMKVVKKEKVVHKSKLAFYNVFVRAKKNKS